MPDTKQVLKVLRDELALQTRHRKLLEAQEQALLQCDRDRFADLQVEHAQMLPELAAQDSVRTAALTDDAGGLLTLAALQELAPPASRAKLKALQLSLRETLDRVQTLTRRNQTLIHNELDYIAFTLDLFLEAGRSHDQGYGPRPAHGGGWAAGRGLLDRRA